MRHLHCITLNCITLAVKKLLQIMKIMKIDMELTELERDILRFALDYTYGYLTDIKKYPEEIEEQIEALKTLTKKLF